MIEDKDEGPAAANDPGEGAVGDLPDEGIALAPDQRLSAIEAELADTRDRLLRALAETENVRRRLQRERDDAQKYAAANFARDLLSAVDNLHRALDAMPESEIKDSKTRSLRDGVAATERELLAAFERHGLRRIDPRGERFDHNFHQAIFEADRPDVPVGTIIEVLQPGYVLHDRLLRPAMVGVAKGGAKAENDGKSAAGNAAA
ncbi:MAG TPA: nucleotide exchange factor GrpE [Stellaceae bacterium]|nr:nucleotide exchange factor GrpE [Stellaceae bacterium]